MGNPSQSYGASLAIWDHTVLPATRHKWTLPAMTPASQAGTQFTYSRRMEGWVDLGSLIATRPGIEPATAWLQVQRRPNRYATESHLLCTNIAANMTKVVIKVGQLHKLCMVGQLYVTCCIFLVLLVAKNYENRLTYVEVTSKGKVALFWHTV